MVLTLKYDYGDGTWRVLATGGTTGTQRYAARDGQWTTDAPDASTKADLRKLSAALGKLAGAKPKAPAKS